MNTQGVGLGLYITKMIVQTFEGQVWVKSQVNEGSTFGLTFKLEQGINNINEINRDLNEVQYWSKQKIEIKILE